MERYSKIREKLMTKAGIIEEVYLNVGLPKKQCAELVDLTFEIIKGYSGTI